MQPLAIGRREAEEGTVAMRRFGIRQQQFVPLAEAKAELLTEIAEKRLPAAVLAEKAAVMNEAG